MPTFGWTARFRRDFNRLSPEQQALFLLAVAQFVEDLHAGGGFRRGLRVKGVRGAEGVFEMAWADDGRATFQYGTGVRAGEAHVIWRRIGTHVRLELDVGVPGGTTHHRETGHHRQRVRRGGRS